MQSHAAAAGPGGLQCTGGNAVRRTAQAGGSGRGPAAPGGAFCCWTNPPTIWTAKVLYGWKIICAPSGQPRHGHHDRYFLERVCNRIVEVNRGKLYCYEANYSRYLALKAERLEMAEAAERKRQALLRRETAWIQQGARARSTKSRDRIERYEALKAQSAPETDTQVSCPLLPLAWAKVHRTDRRGKIFCGESVCSSLFSCPIGRRARIGVVGRNGAGKKHPAQSDRRDTGAGQRHGRGGPDGAHWLFYPRGRPDHGRAGAGVRFHHRHRPGNPHRRRHFYCRTDARTVSVSPARLSANLSAACPAANGGGCICSVSLWAHLTYC